MSLSGNKGAPPAGLDQALRLIEICKDPDKYASLLDPLKKSSADARKAWQEVGLAGDIHKLHEAAEVDRETAAKELEDAKQASQKRLAELDREYTVKAKNLRQRQQDFDAERNKAADDLVSRSRDLDERAKKLLQAETKLVADRKALEADQQQLAKDQAEVERRLAPFKEVINNG